MALRFGAMKSPRGLTTRSIMARPEPLIGPVRSVVSCALLRQLHVVPNGLSRPSSSPAPTQVPSAYQTLSWTWRHTSSLLKTRRLTPSCLLRCAGRTAPLGVTKRHLHVDRKDVYRGSSST